MTDTFQLFIDSKQKQFIFILRPELSKQIIVKLSIFDPCVTSFMNAPFRKMKLYLVNTACTGTKGHRRLNPGSIKK